MVESVKEFLLLLEGCFHMNFCDRNESESGARILAEYKACPDRRRYLRYAINQPARSGGTGFLASRFCQHPCILMDVSLGGVRLRTTAVYETGREITMRFDLFGSSSRFRLRGRIVRASDRGDGWHEYGVEFKNLSERQRASLINGLDRFAYCK